ncbi:peroxiredoxin family protein [Marinoscillum furvescens]|uniref:Peroxiredoxin n=1 Tax=Marinoscillum furvescens DSM 4134 TaxID=1122208 RepID=A0A3D9L0C3_MARFU|nr:TlpA disulfide reductase family protein [Marinoscillum furvescens]RED95611.1 peroxiredoxin [Marinoscillum furvescens DSM 4134]
MKSIQTALIVLTLTIFISSCNDGGSSSDGVRVFGKVENPIEGEQVVFSEFKDGGLLPLDTPTVDMSGAFEFFVSAEGQSFYRLNFYNRQQMNLILDGTEDEVEILLEGDNPQGEVSVKGSKHTQYLKQIEGMVRDQRQDIQDLNQEAIQARMDNDQQTLERLTNEYYDLMRVRQGELKELIWNVTPSLAVFYGLENLSIEENFEFYDSVAQKMNAGLPEHEFTKQLVAKVDGARKLAVGAEAPEIELPNPDGEMISLSSLRGNYVLVDFWAAWCKPCRAENPNVVRLYNQYKNENFEILGVSLDRTKDAWVKAIEQDGLPWKHVSDLKYFNSEAAATYQISAIPATYLIGPDGKIIAKGLRGATLRAKLEEIFG